MKTRFDIILWGALFGGSTACVLSAFLGYYGEPWIYWMIITILSWLISFTMGMCAIETLRKELNGKEV